MCDCVHMRVHVCLSMCEYMFSYFSFVCCFELAGELVILLFLYFFWFQSNKTFMLNEVKISWASVNIFVPTVFYPIGAKCKQRGMEHKLRGHVVFLW